MTVRVCSVWLVAAMLTAPGAAALAADAQPLQVGAMAPTFAAEASLAGKNYRFSMQQALAKGPVVLYFYPAAYTGGCNLEAHTFATQAKAFAAAGATIIGVSADSLARLDEFSADPNYCAGEFPVASDPDGKVALRYGLTMVPPQAGVLDVKGRPVEHGFFPRTTFVVDGKGRIVARLSSADDHLKPDQHVTRALAIVRGLKAQPAH